MPLTLVPTPIGNLEDITLRALRVLREADLIACEDTRTSGILLKRYAISKPLVSLHEYNEKERGVQLLQNLREGRKIAVISDAGTPGISDPGFLLLQEAMREGIEIDVLPGPSALLPALLLSGLSPHPFFFYGFPPEKSGQRKNLFQALASLPCTLVFYISPHKAGRQVSDMLETWGSRRAALVRETSKIYQEAVKGTLTDISARLDEGVKGELVLVVEGCPEEAAPSGEWKERCRTLFEEGLTLKSIVQEIQELYGVRKNAIKDFLLECRADAPKDEDENR